MIHVRCSSLPVAVACPGSVHPLPDDVLIDPVNEWAAVGSAVHEVLAHVITNDPDSLPPLLPYAEKHGCDVEEVGWRAGYGFKAWRELKPAFPIPNVEQAFSNDGHPSIEHARLTGHIDVSAVIDNWRAINIVDWKSGHKEPDAYQQMAGYAFLAWIQDPRVQEVAATVAWLPDQTFLTYRFTDEDLDTWYQAVLVDRIAKWDGEYHPGEQCSKCPRFACCPARQQMVRSVTYELSMTDVADWIMAAPAGEVLPKLVELKASGRLDVLKKALEAANARLRQEAALGPIPLGNGKALALRNEPRDTIVPEKAWPIIGEFMDVRAAMAIVKLPKGALVDALKAAIRYQHGGKPPRGALTATVDTMLESLRLAGALIETPVSTLRTVNLQELSDGRP